MHLQFCASAKDGLSLSSLILVAISYVALMFLCYLLYYCRWCELSLNDEWIPFCVCHALVCSEPGWMKEKYMWISDPMRSWKVSSQKTHLLMFLKCIVSKHHSTFNTTKVAVRSCIFFIIWTNGCILWQLYVYFMSAFCACLCWLCVRFCFGFAITEVTTCKLW